MALAAEMLERARTPNRLQQYITERGLGNRRAGWFDHTALELPAFPRLTLDQLRDITLGNSI